MKKIVTSFSVSWFTVSSHGNVQTAKEEINFVNCSDFFLNGCRCHRGFVYANFIRSLNACVISVSRFLLQLIFVQNGLLGLSYDFIGVNSVLNFLCTLCTIP